MKTQLLRRAQRLLAACLFSVLGSLLAGAANFIVTLSGFSFSPQTVTITAGDSITFTNKGGFHNATCQDAVRRAV
ncbi:MAG: hypothetical protein EXS36_02260 [Pedosphaera sp.]|nr:hypothetical protein [Pedosphaera sp.]